LGKVKLMGRTVAQVHREAEGSLLAVQLLLAQGLLAQPAARRARPAVPSARHVVRVIRAEIAAVAGSYLRRRQPSYRERLGSARVDRRRRRTNQVRRRWPARSNHKPPKPPKLQRLGTALKDLLDTVLGTE
jgi:hypothetical protein